MAKYNAQLIRVGEDFVKHHENAICTASKNGYEIVRRESNELLIDLDTVNLSEFFERLAYVGKWLSIENIETWSSKTKGHHHARVTLGRLPVELTNTEMILLQCILGSDYKRELLSLKGCKIGEQDFSVLFKPKSLCVT